MMPTRPLSPTTGAVLGRSPNECGRRPPISNPSGRLILGGGTPPGKRAGKRLAFAWLIASALCVSSLRADVVLLKNGNELEGRVRSLPNGDLEVFLEPGQVYVVRASEVAGHKVREAPYDELQRRLSELKPDDRDGHDRLARWAEGARLRTSAREVYARLLRIDPHHVGARDRLGYVLFRNRWVLRSDLEERGLVRFRGLWMDPEEVESIRAKEAIEQFQNVLEDIHHDNRYLRDNALLTAVKESNPKVLPFIKELLKATDPLERLVAGRVLANFSFDEAAADVFQALMLEAREEVRAAFLTTLRGYGDRRLVSWMSTHFDRWNELDPTARRNGLVLFQVCPHREPLVSLLGLLTDPDWGAVVARALVQVAGGEPRTNEEWVRWGRTKAPELPEDLGCGWLKR